MSTPRYAIVVATRNRGLKIVPLLESILASKDPHFELVVVDQSDGDATRLAVEPFTRDARVRYVHTSTPGASRARNLGMSLTCAPLIAITDDDCIVPPDWLPRLTAPFERNPRIGVVFCNVHPLVVHASGYTPQIHFPQSRTIQSAGEAWAHSRKGFPLGAGMALRRAVLSDVHGFDESLGPGSKFPAAEDNDLAWRALLHGWWVHENADVSVLHDGYRSAADLRELVKRDFYGVGGAIAKYLKTGHVGALGLLISWTVRFGLLEPAADLLEGRRPRGFRRPFLLLRGLTGGLLTPLEKPALRYRIEPNTASGIDSGRQRTAAGIDSTSVS